MLKQRPAGQRGIKIPNGVSEMFEGGEEARECFSQHGQKDGDPRERMMHDKSPAEGGAFQVPS